MGNSSSHEQPRVPNAAQSADQSVAASALTSPGDFSNLETTDSSQIESSSFIDKNAGDDYFSAPPTASTAAAAAAAASAAGGGGGGGVATSAAVPTRPKSIMSTESMDSLPTASHCEEASVDDDELIYRQRTTGPGLDDIREGHVEHAEDVSRDLQRVRLSDTADDTSVTDKAAEDVSIPAKPVSKMLSGEEIDFYYGQPSEQAVPTVISWIHGGKKVYVTGTFTGWRKMIKLAKNGNDFSTVINLPPGTHRIRFVVDNELRCSDALPTATDSMGNLVNYIEVAAIELPPLERESQIEDEQYEDEVPVAPLHYTNEIPDIFTNPSLAENQINEVCDAPPFLPPHLETVILNSNSTEKDDSSVLPIPNHVVLNHLATTSIKHNVLAVASVSRYARKYVTQILYAPL